MISRWFAAAFSVAFSLCSFSIVQAQTAPSGGMIRFPDVSADQIVFVYGEDLWLVPREGGIASPLASPPGEESLPRFSPDGKTVAFVGHYDGNQDLYTISIAGGPAQRVTFHPDRELLCDWTAAGELIFSSGAYSGLSRQSKLFLQKPGDPIETELPVPYGSNGAISADGKWLAYTPHSSDYRTWKRYRGGMAADIWLFNLETKESKQITEFEGTDSLPMWHDNVIYYVSDGGPEHRLNIWMYHTATGERKQVTKFTDDDCKWPSIGPGPTGKGEIVVQVGTKVYLVDLATEAITTVDIVIPGDRPRLRPRMVDAAKFISAHSLSPNAKRIVVEARGDLWTLPVKNGSPRNLTRTSGIAERDPSWSPDGRSIAYFSDASGEYELYLIPSDGSGEAKSIAKDGTGYYYLPTWSPNSKWITFSDKTGALYLYSVDRGETKQIDRDPTAGSISPNWSHDSRWITYGRAEDQRAPTTAIWVYHVENGTKQKLTSGFFNDANPVFDRSGEYLYFASSRSFTSPKYDDLGTNFVYTDSEVLMAMPLRRDLESPLMPKSDEETWDDANDKEKDKEKEKDSDKTGKNEDGDSAASGQTSESVESSDKAQDGGSGKQKEKKQPEAFDIEFSGIEARSFQIPVEAGRFGQIAINDKGHLIYLRRGKERGEGGDLKLLDLNADELKEKDIVAGVARFSSSSDGKKLLVVKPSRGKDTLDAYLVDASEGQKLEKGIPTKGMEVSIEPRAEWEQVFNESWRVQRDFFYDPNMHGVNWKKVREHYQAMLQDCVSRRDVSFVIREMISELNVGHAYYSEGDVESPETINVGLMGCRFELHAGAYRFKSLYRGADWDVDGRNPLLAAGVKEGQYLLAVNGIPVSAEESPYRPFIGKAGMTVVLTISDDHELDADDRRVPVTLLGSEETLKFRNWIETNRRYVEEKSQGKVGYIYVVNTGVPGQNDLVRQFFGQLNKEALIIDDRWNGGGQIPTRFIEMLNRPATNAWARRDGRDWVWPPDSHQGPKCMLINGMAGSGGDMFPALFKQNGLGPLIGMRTWGGLVGISGGPTNIDGSNVTAPTFAYYKLDGNWGIEGHGVDPDLKVVDDPGKMIDGGDPQLDVAIDEMLKAIKVSGFQPPARPAYPDRSKMGIRPEDK